MGRQPDSGGCAQTSLSMWMCRVWADVAGRADSPAGAGLQLREGRAGLVESLAGEDLVGRVVRLVAATLEMLLIKQPRIGTRNSNV